MAIGQSSEGTVNLNQENEDLNVSLYFSHHSKLLWAHKVKIEVKIISMVYSTSLDEQQR